MCIRVPLLGGYWIPIFVFSTDSIKFLFEHEELPSFSSPALCSSIIGQLPWDKNHFDGRLPFLCYILTVIAARPNTSLPSADVFVPIIFTFPPLQPQEVIRRDMDWSCLYWQSMLDPAPPRAWTTVNAVWLRNGWRWELLSEKTVHATLTAKDANKQRAARRDNDRRLRQWFPNLIGFHLLRREDVPETQTLWPHLEAVETYTYWLGNGLFLFFQLWLLFICATLGGELFQVLTDSSNSRALYGLQTRVLGGFLFPGLKKTMLERSITDIIDVLTSIDNWHWHGERDHSLLGVPGRWLFYAFQND